MSGPKTKSDRISTRLVVDRRRPLESGHGHIRAIASPGAGLVEIRDGQGGTARVNYGDLEGLIGILERFRAYLKREAER